MYKCPLDEAKVKQIYALGRDRKLYYSEIAKLMNVHPNTVCKLLNGLTHRDLYQQLTQPLTTGIIRRENPHYVSPFDQTVYINLGGGGGHALVDLADWERVRQHRWYRFKHAKTKIAYAMANVQVKKGVFRTVHLKTFLGCKALRWKNGNQLDCRRANLIPK